MHYFTGCHRLIKNAENTQSLKENLAYNGSLNCVTFNKRTYNSRVGLLIDHYKKLSFRNQEDALDGITLINRCKKINFLAKNDATTKMAQEHT